MAHSAGARGFASGIPDRSQQREHIELRNLQAAADTVAANAGLPLHGKVKDLAKTDEDNALVAVGVGLMRNAALLSVGYASKQAMGKYERTANYKHWQQVLTVKIQNVTTVAGLIMSSTWSMLASGNLGASAYTCAMATIALCLLSIISGLLCLSPLLCAAPKRLEILVKHHPKWFWYLFAGPCGFGGLSALTFFAALTCYSWEARCFPLYGWGGRIVSLLGVGALMVNAGICLFLGGTRSWRHVKVD